MKQLVIIGLISLVGCADSKQSLNLNQDAALLYNEFISDSNIEGMNLSYDQPITVEFSDLSNRLNSAGTTVGLCTMIGYSIPGAKVLLDRGFWQVADDNMKRIILYHELGHCLLARIHSTNKDSIMYPVVNYPYANAVNFNEMIEELFINKGN